MNNKGQNNCRVSSKTISIKDSNNIISRKKRDSNNKNRIINNKTIIIFMDSSNNRRQKIITKTMKTKTDSKSMRQRIMNRHKIDMRNKIKRIKMIFRMTMSQQIDRVQIRMGYNKYRRIKYMI